MHSTNDKIPKVEPHPLLPDAVLAGCGTDRKDPRLVPPKLAFAQWQGGQSVCTRR